MTITHLPPTDADALVARRWCADHGFDPDEVAISEVVEERYASGRRARRIGLRLPGHTATSSTWIMG